jgi:hypothetical protein
VLDGAAKASRVVPSPVFAAVGPVDERGPAVPVPAPCHDRCGMPALVSEQDDCLRAPGNKPVSVDQLTLGNTGEDRLSCHRLTVTSSYERSQQH